MKIIFSTPQGMVEDDFPSDEPLHALKGAVLARLKLPSDWADQYIIAYDGNTLEESNSLAELGLPENSTLVVWRVSSSPTGKARTWDRSQE